MDKVDFFSRSIFAKLSKTAYHEIKLRDTLLTGFVLGGLDWFVA